MPGEQRSEVKRAPAATTTPAAKAAAPAKPAPATVEQPAATWSPLALAIVGALGGSALVLSIGLALFGLVSTRTNTIRPAPQVSADQTSTATVADLPRQSIAASEPQLTAEPPPALAPPLSPPPALLGEQPQNPPPVVATVAPQPPVAPTAPPTKVADSSSAPSPQEPKTAPKTEAKPPTPPPAGQVAKPRPPAKTNPFKGLEKTISLPPLPSAGALADSSLSNLFPLGDCQTGDKTEIQATLKGGAAIFRGGKQRFELKPAGSPPTRNWEFLYAGGDTSSIIAALSVSGGKLNFQWTDEGLEQAATSRLLCNCALDLAADGFQHTLALRQPVMGPPLAIAIEKGGGTARWTFEHLPDLKQVFLQPTRFDGLRRRRVEPAEPINPGKDLTIWTGPRDDMMFLGLKFDSDLLPTGLKMTVAAQLKPEGAERATPYSKKDMQNRLQQTKQQQAALNQKLQEASKPLPGADRAQIDAMKAQLRQEIDLRTKWAGQIDALSKYATDVQGSVAIHFRVYFQADDRQVDLFIAGDPPPLPKPAPRPPAPPPTTPKPAT